MEKKVILWEIIMMGVAWVFFYEPLNKWRNNKEVDRDVLQNMMGAC